MKTEDSHWSRIAQFWHLVGPPLRPSKEDLIHFERAVLGRVDTLERGPMRVLIFGVTPEFAALNWPAGTILKVLDGSPEMLKALWKGPANEAVCGSWTATPFEDASLDMIVCDGGIGLLSYPQGQLALFSEVKRLLAPNGIFTFRLFAPGCHSETIEHIVSDLDRGAIPSLDALKFKFWGALQATAETGVRPVDVVKNIELAVGSLERLVDHFGWPAAHVATLEFHRTSRAVYCLSDVNEVRSLIALLPGMKVASVDIPQHVFGDRCPVVSIERTGS